MRKHEKPDHARIRMTTNVDGTKGLRVFTPQSVLPVHSREELDAALQHYSRESALSNVSVDEPGAKRKYVELIRPALRYYCKKYDKECPRWLKDDSYYTDTMTDLERIKHFGPKPLVIKEFNRVRAVDEADDTAKGA